MVRRVPVPVSVPVRATSTEPQISQDDSRTRLFTLHKHRVYLVDNGYTGEINNRNGFNGRERWCL